MSVLLASSNNYIFYGCKYALFEFKYRLTQFSIDCDPFQDKEWIERKQIALHAGHRPETDLIPKHLFISLIKPFPIQKGFFVSHIYLNFLVNP